MLPLSPWSLSQENMGGVLRCHVLDLLLLSLESPLGSFEIKNHFINVAVLQNKIVYRGLEENYINLCLVFMECRCSDCFISIKRAHCGFIRVE